MLTRQEIPQKRFSGADLAFFESGGRTRICPPENFENLGTLTCNLVQSGKSNIRIPY